jgi:transposase-like protein
MTRTTDSSTDIAIRTRMESALMSYTEFTKAIIKRYPNIIAELDE